MEDAATPAVPETPVPAGPLQKALRDAGLPFTSTALDLLEKLARMSYVGTRAPSIRELRRAARKYRQITSNPQRMAVVAYPGKQAHRPAVAPEPVMTKSHAKQVVRTANGLQSGRQWKKWKKAQQRSMKAHQPQPEDPHATHP